jgi:tripartite-type tricarboxylate transporter receptor subunit TctC
MNGKSLVAILAVAPLFPCADAPAQGYPAKTIRIVVPFPVGGPSDANARIVGQHLTERWKQQVIVDARPGGNTVIGTDHVAKSPPDGHTLLLTSTAYAAAPVIQAKLPYDPYTDLAPVTIVSISAQALVAHPSLPVKNVKELIALAKARPGQLNLANVDPSTMMAAHLFCMLAGVKIEAVPYKGAAPMMIDLMGGHVTLGIAAVSSVQAAAREGRVRILGVGSHAPTPMFPDAPVISKDLAGFEAVAWFGLFVPGKTPRDIVGRIHKEVASILQLPDVRQRLADYGGEPGGLAPEEFSARIRSEIERWQKVAKAAGIKPQ